MLSCYQCAFNLLVTDSLNILLPWPLFNWILVLLLIASFVKFLSKCNVTLLIALSSMWHRYVYLLTPWCRVLEKLTGLQLVKKLPAFHRTGSFITTLTSVRHLSLSWARPIQFIYPRPTSWRSILILSTHLCLGMQHWWKFERGLFQCGM